MAGHLGHLSGTGEDVHHVVSVDDIRPGDHDVSQGCHMIRIFPLVEPKVRCFLDPGWQPWLKMNLERQAFPDPLQRDQGT